MLNEEETATKTEAGETKPKTKKKKAAKKKTAKKAKAAAKKKNGGSPLNAERKDVYAALLRLHADGPRGSIVERMAKNSGKTFTAEQIAKWVDWEPRAVQQFCTQRVKTKLSKYPDAAKRIKLLAEGDGKYGLEVK